MTVCVLRCCAAGGVQAGQQLHAPAAVLLWTEAEVLTLVGCTGSDPAPQGQPPFNRAVTSAVTFRSSDLLQSGGLTLDSSSRSKTGLRVAHSPLLQLRLGAVTCLAPVTSPVCRGLCVTVTV